MEHFTLKKVERGTVNYGSYMQCTFACCVIRNTCNTDQNSFGRQSVSYCTKSNKAGRLFYERERHV